LIERKFLDGLVQDLALLLPRERLVRGDVIGREAKGGTGTTPGLRLFDGKRRHLVDPALPPAFLVLRAVDDDAIDPGPQRGVPPEGRELSINLQEDFLRQIDGLVVAAKKPARKTEDHVLITKHKLVESGVVACETPIDQRGFIQR
jgi:hypothetical protein